MVDKHKHSLLLLYIQEISLFYNKYRLFWGTGKIKIDKTRNTATYWVADLKSFIEIIILFFEKYSLITQKLADFKLFKKAVELISNKEHLTITGLENLISIKASMNRGLSQNLNKDLSNIIPVDRPKIETTKIPDPNWIAGFSTGESCFDVNITKSKEYKLGYQTQIRFRTTQHVRDKALLHLIISYLDCGKLNSSREVVNISIVNLEDILQKIIPFFNKYPIQGCKQLDYLDFCKVAFLMKNKTHLTEDGLNQIKEIKLRMNTNRQYGLN